ncbi:MAG: tetratricopeptide repeat protein [Elusimicrobia bacterium]|nr:tetratricopeptide repeat protein [Elusimicrobiota bacterium]
MVKKNSDPQKGGSKGIPGPGGGDADRYFSLAVEHEKTGRYDLAAEQFRKALEHGFNPEHVRKCLGMVYFKKGEYPSALEEFGAAQRLNPDDGEVYSEAGRVYYVMGDYDSAIREFRTAIYEKNYSGNRVVRDLGLAYLKKKSYGKALAELERAAEADPSDGEVLADIGRVYCGQGRLESAEGKFSEAIAKGYDTADMRVEFGEVLYGRKKYDQALCQFREAGKSDGHFHKACIGSARSLTKLGDFKGALKILKKLSAKEPSDPEVYMEISRVYEAGGEYDSSVRILSKALKKGVAAEDLARYLGKIYFEKGQCNLQRALKKRNKALGMKTGEPGIDADSESGGILACREEKKEDYELANPEFKKAGADFKEAIRLGFDDECVYKGLGSVYYYTGEYGPAAREFERIAQRYPSRQSIVRLGLMYQAQKRLDLSLEQIYRYQEIDSENDIEDNRRLLEYAKANSRKNSQGRPAVKIIKMPVLIKDEDAELDHTFLMPLGIARIAAYLRSNGINIDQDDLYIKINIDNRFGPEDERIDKDIFVDRKRVAAYVRGAEDPLMDAVMEKVEKKTKMKGYDVILLSIPLVFDNESADMFALSLSRYLKKKYNPVIVVGGFDDYMYPVIKENSDNIDFIIRGEGEKPLIKLLTALEHGLDISKLPDFSLDKDGKSVRNIKHVAAVRPDFEGLPIRMYRYRGRRRLDGADEETKTILSEFNRSGILISPFMMQQSCPHSCIFCAASAGRMVNMMSPKTAVEYMKDIKQKHDVTGFFFINRTLNITRKYVDEFCDRILEEGLKVLWSDCVRGEIFDEDLLKKMRAAGCISLVYGMETASPRMLKYINKSISPVHMREILRSTDEAGIWTRLEIICGYPHETEEDFRETLDFIENNKEHVNRFYYNMLYLREGSKLFLYPHRYGVKNVFRVKFDDYPLRNIRGLKYGYDEIKGLSWENKFDQIIERYNRVAAAIGEKEGIPDFEDTHFVYFLYTRYSDKRQIARVYDKVRKAIAERKKTDHGKTGK